MLRPMAGRVATFGGRYRVRERIGHGGMAEVYLASATGAAGFERAVVLKRLLPNLAEDPRMAASFLEEARLLAMLNHPHIAQVYDVGEGPEGAYLVMEYIAGRDLREVMATARAPIDPGVAALVVRDVAEALDYGFQLTDEGGVPLKLIHRDVSLSNIMISMTGAVKLVDFGLARALTALDREHTSEGVVKGKWSYLAPEVLHGTPPDHRSDIFSTGVVLWELCAGRKLYKPSNDPVAVAAERDATPPPPSSVVKSVPRELDKIVLKALARDPARRFAVAEELAAALDEIVHQRKVRPGHVTEMMEQLFAPKRMRPTQEMSLGDLTAALAQEGSTDSMSAIPTELRAAEPSPNPDAPRREPPRPAPPRPAPLVIAPVPVAPTPPRRPLPGIVEGSPEMTRVAPPSMPPRARFEPINTEVPTRAAPRRPPPKSSRLAVVSLVAVLVLVAVFALAYVLQ
ncbi:MAG: serine/threonine protein kinase [Myxococcales bacterium]|nr:serine/threonine protein kinase [Myxococcales bacterium]